MTIQLNWKTPTKIVRWHNWAEQNVKKIVIFPDGVTEKQIRPRDYWYYSEANYSEFKSLVNSVWSVQFVDSWKRFRFEFWVYIWNRTALDFKMKSNTVRIINIDNFSLSSKTLPFSMPNDLFSVWYFWENRILTPRWLIDFDWNVVNTFAISFNSIVPWLPWIVWANSWYDIYKWTVYWDNIVFEKIWTWATDQSVWLMNYWYLWAYLLNSNDTSWGWNSSYINPTTNIITNFKWWNNTRQAYGCAGVDWKIYRNSMRDNWRWRLQKIWTWDEWFVWNQLSSNWVAYWIRFGKFLWNIVSWWMNSNGWTWNWYWSNSYFIDLNWNITNSQSNAFAYDTYVYTNFWFIDENWRLYPYTNWWWQWVILKTDKTFTNLNWKNPYLRR